MDRQSRKTPRRMRATLYIPRGMLDLLELESRRLERALPWLIERCVRHALPSIRALPSTGESVVEAGMERAQAEAAQ